MTDPIMAICLIENPDPVNPAVPTMALFNLDWLFPGTDNTPLLNLIVFRSFITQPNSLNIVRLYSMSVYVKMIKDIVKRIQSKIAILTIKQDNILKRLYIEDDSNA